MTTSFKRCNSGCGKFSSWTPAEDATLTSAVNELSCSKCSNIYRPDCECKTFMKKKTWDDISKTVGGGRTSGACQARWCSKLDPMLDVSPWDDAMDRKLLKMVEAKEGTWVTRAQKLSKPPKRRNGGEVAKRYFELSKKKTATKRERE
eukprot:PhF_6_TR13284/c0_g1_i2/m.21056